jgi:hypothetical protein
MAEWYPNAQESRLGQEGYLRYLGAVVLIHDPDSAFAVGMLGRRVRDPSIIVSHGNGLMYNGLRTFIKYANPPDARGDLVRAEHAYEAALSHMIATVDEAYATQSARIDRMNGALFALRPQPPVTDEVTYKYLCHSRRDMLFTLSLMDGIRPAESLMAYVQGRTLSTTESLPVPPDASENPESAGL